MLPIWVSGLHHTLWKPAPQLTSTSFSIEAGLDARVASGCAVGRTPVSREEYAPDSSRTIPKSKCCIRVLLAGVDPLYAHAVQMAKPASAVAIRRIHAGSRMSEADLDEFLDRVGTGCAGRVRSCGRPHPDHQNRRCEWLVTDDVDVAGTTCGVCHRVVPTYICRDDISTYCRKGVMECRITHRPEGLAK
jgi:hypothetical protein